MFSQSARVSPPTLESRISKGSTHVGGTRYVAGQAAELASAIDLVLDDGINQGLGAELPGILRRLTAVCLSVVAATWKD